MKKVLISLAEENFRASKAKKAKSAAKVHSEFNESNTISEISAKQRLAGSVSEKVTLNGEVVKLRSPKFESIIKINATFVAKFNIVGTIKVPTNAQFFTEVNDEKFTSVEELALEVAIQEGWDLQTALGYFSHLCWNYQGSARNAMKRRIKKFLKDQGAVNYFHSILVEESKNDNNATIVAEVVLPDDSKIVYTTRTKGYKLPTLGDI